MSASIVKSEPNEEIVHSTQGHRSMEYDEQHAPMNTTTFTIKEEFPFDEIIGQYENGSLPPPPPMMRISNTPEENGSDWSGGTDNSDSEMLNLADMQKIKRTHEDDDSPCSSPDQDFPSTSQSNIPCSNNVGNRELGPPGMKKGAAMNVGDRQIHKRDPAVKRARIWTNGESRFLLELYSKYVTEIGPMRKFRMKKDMWAAIASKIPGKNAKQCEERYKTVLKQKERVVKKPYTIRKNREKQENEIDFNFNIEDELLNTISRESSLEPEEPTDILPPTIETEKKLKIKKEDEKKVITKIIPNVGDGPKNITKKPEEQKGKDKLLENTRKKIPPTIQETLLEIAARKEEGRERRHREKMEALENLQQLLRKIFEQQTQT